MSAKTSRRGPSRRVSPGLASSSDDEPSHLVVPSDRRRRRRRQPGWNGARASRTRARSRQTSRRTSRRARRAGRYGRRARAPTSAAWRPGERYGTTTDDDRSRRGRPRRERPPRPANRRSRTRRDAQDAIFEVRLAARRAPRARVTRASRAPVPDRVVVACRDDTYSWARIARRADLALRLELPKTGQARRGSTRWPLGRAKSERARPRWRCDARWRGECDVGSRISDDMAHV